MAKREPSIYARGKRLWGRVKNEFGKWVSLPTEHNVGAEDKARREIAEAQRIFDAKRKLNPEGPLTFRRYVENWLKDRKKRDLASFRDDAGRLNNHALPLIGDVPLDECRVRHVRDMVRKLERDPDLAPRTVLHVVSIVRAVLRDAARDELITGAPWDLARHDLPQKSDKDPEWRELATYTKTEVVQLITDDRIPQIRRVQYALKALAGLRHGEVAGLRWRNWIDDEPMSALQVARSYQKRRTKTEVTRRVPVVPALEEILDGWQGASLDATPEADDLIVSTRAGAVISAHYAHAAFLDDLGLLGLRLSAGEHRKRGGHDLRAWFITTCKENGASPEDVARITHTKRGDVMSGYTRTNWGKLCEAAGKVGVTL